MPESEPSPELAKTKAEIAANDPMVKALVAPAWRKEGGATIDHGGGFVSHEVDPDKLPQALLDALADAKKEPLVSRGSFSEFDEYDA